MGGREDANLQGANLWLSELPHVDLTRANLQNAGFAGANLQSAMLIGADLRGANFTQADLKNAYLRPAKFSPNTTLPDRSKWTPERDLREFTQPDEWLAEQAIKQSDNTT